MSENTSTSTHTTTNEVEEEVTNGTIEDGEHNVVPSSNDESNEPNEHESISTKRWYRENWLLSEFRELHKYIPSGVLLLPSLQHKDVLQGGIFIRCGIYRGGIFRFFIFLDEEYPRSMPRVVFTTNLFHPMVNNDNGELGGIELALPEWSSHTYLLCHVLAYVKRIFYNLERPWVPGDSHDVEEFVATLADEENSVQVHCVNKAACDMYYNDGEAFTSSAQQCVQNSIDNAFSTKSDYNSDFPAGLQFKQFTDDHATLRRDILSRENSQNSSTLSTLFSKGASVARTLLRPF